MNFSQAICKDCDQADRSVRYSLWWYCKDPADFRNFTIGRDGAASVPEWCPMIDDSRQVDLDLMSSLLTLVRAIFKRFKKDCEHREGIGCGHKDYHKDFALANICNLKSCPALEEED